MSLHLITDLENNYELFINRVKKSKVVWGLKSDDGWANCPSNKYDCNVILFWSDKAYAKRSAVEEWASYKPMEIDLESFIVRWLSGMRQDGVLAGVEPSKLAKKLMS